MNEMRIYLYSRGGRDRLAGVVDDDIAAEIDQAEANGDHERMNDLAGCSTANCFSRNGSEGELLAEALANHARGYRMYSAEESFFEAACDRSVIKCLRIWEAVNDPPGSELCDDCGEYYNADECPNSSCRVYEKTIGRKEKR